MVNDLFRFSAHIVSRKVCRSERAATMIETAILLPLILFLIFLVIWIGISFHEKAALRSALGTGIRLAATRGDRLLMHSTSGVIPRIQEWVNNACPGVISPPFELDPVLEYNIPGGSTWGGDYYNDGHPGKGALRVFSAYFGGHGQVSLHCMPPSYIFALIYIHESIRQSVGSSVKYPCDPFTDPEPEGCVGCFFLNPDNFDQSDYEVGGVLAPPPTDRVAIQCDYRPSNFLLGPMTGLLRMMVGGSAGPFDFVFTERRRVTFSDGVVE